MEHPRTASPVLADADRVVSDQLRSRLRSLAASLKPHVRELDAKFLNRLQRLGFEKKQCTALCSVTPGAAIRIAIRGRSLQVFLEQVEYNGRRLAKLNLPPRDVVEALAEYDSLLTPVLKSLPNGGGDNHWALDQLQLSVGLTLNKAYYQVRETEAQAFYELSRAELESRSLDHLLGKSLQVLARFCDAKEAGLYLLDDENSNWILKANAGINGHSRRQGALKPVKLTSPAARKRQLGRPRSLVPGSRSSSALLDSSWAKRFRSAWSVPLLSGDSVSGVMQFAFDKKYDWLPREQELLEAAAERCLVAAEKAKLLENLAARKEQIRRLAEHMLHVEEEERRRISRELHDEAGQSLLYIRLQLEMLEKQPPEQCEDWKSRLEGVREVTERTIVETRRLIAALSPAVLDQLGLAPAVRQLLNRLRQIYPCRVNLHLSHLENLPKRTETIAYRLVQECCNNIMKHSKASNVNISVVSADGVLRLEVEDDGVGFDVANALRQNATFGLAGMRERVTLLGGSFEIQSKASDRGRRRRGTRITAELPVLGAIKKVSLGGSGQQWPDSPGNG